jgi:hypothetical protein
MIAYGYNEQLQPPAPFVYVTIRCEEAGTIADNVPAQLDSAADRSVIPSSLVTELGLIPLDEIHVGGFGGQVFVVPTYRVELAIRGMQAYITEVIAHEEETIVLLGRDILNRYNITMLGPSLKLRIES